MHKSLIRNNDNDNESIYYTPRSEFDEKDNKDDFFIGNNREKINFNIFRKPLNFLSAIYRGDISLKEAEINQKKLEKKIEDLIGYKNNAKEKEEINRVLMQANDLLKYRDKIIDAFKDGTFLSEH